MNQVESNGKYKNLEQRTVKKFDQKGSLNIQWTISQCTLYFVPQMPGNRCACGCQGRVAKKGMIKPDHTDRDGVTPAMRRRDAAVRKNQNAYTREQQRRVYANGRRRGTIFGRVFFSQLPAWSKFPQQAEENSQNKVYYTGRGYSWH